MGHRFEDNSVLLEYVSVLPQKVLSLHGYENIPEFLLHDLCHEECFGVDRVAYFVDNPDFDHMKGVAGFLRGEHYNDLDQLWGSPEKFNKHMDNNARFHEHVRSFECNSLTRENKSEHDFAGEVAEQFSFSNPTISMWRLKNDNNGVVMFEKKGMWTDILMRQFLNSLHLLGFCPIY